MRRSIGLLIAAVATPALAQPVVFVNANLTTGADDGSSWSNAYHGPQALKRAMDLTPALSGSQLWVAQGRYTPAPPFGSRRAFFQMKTGVAVYGGFASGETSLAQRDPAAHPVILSADLNGDDDDQHDSENSIHLVQAIDTDNTARLDGVSIRGGFAWGLDGSFAVPDTFGANLLIDHSHATFVNCTISDTFAGQGGGAHLDGSSNPTFTDCVFTRNTGQDEGGGVFVAPDSSGHFLRCDFIANTGGVGAGLFNGWFFPGSPVSTPILEDCRFIDNLGNIGAAPGPGVFDGSSATLIRCQFHRNRTGAGGGGLFCAGTGTTVIACVFTGNEGTGDGGDAIRVESGINSFTNCAFYAQGGPVSGPVAGHASGITAWVTGGHTDFINCTFANNNLHHSTTFINDAALLVAGSGFPAPPTSAQLDNCIIWNNRNQSGFGQSAALSIQGAAVFINHSLVQGWTGSIPGTATSAADPLFTSIAGPDGLAGTPDDDLRLSPTSPAIDSANNAPVLAALTTAPRTDLAGQPRFTDDPFTTDTGPGTAPIADRGAHEFQPACRADLNADGLVDFADYLTFLNLFDATDPRADFNNDGLTDFADYLDFLNHYDAGC